MLPTVIFILLRSFENLSAEVIVVDIINAPAMPTYQYHNGATYTKPSKHNKKVYYIYLILIFSFSLFSRQFKRHCSMILAKKDNKTNQKTKKKGKIVGHFLSWSKFLCTYSPSICPFIRPHLLISALFMHLPP